MSYKATVIPVMIASPSDVQEERKLATEVIYEWNHIYSPSNEIVLMPMAWETHSSPELSGEAQQQINERILQKCDLLVGIFWTRLGTPTESAPSGSVDEIQRHHSEGKPVLVYFSDVAARPSSYDPSQYESLKLFKEWCRGEGLTETYTTHEEFRRKFARQLAITLHDNPYLKEIFKDARAETSTFLGLPVDDKSGIPFASALSKEARELLLEASLDARGEIIKRGYNNGTIIQTNKKTFNESGDRRSTARWEAALNQLLTEGLVEPRDARGFIFLITQRGYDVVEMLKA